MGDLSLSHSILSSEKESEASLLKILVATDCHLGYEESNPIIGEDSFITFEEVLIKAVDKDVDFILLGGDLFHHNNPSQKTMKKCIDLLRQYTLGSQRVKFELLSRVKDVFSNSVNQTANFLDDNINVSIPVLSIHGNHDDPSGLGQLSSLDTLASAGLVNYFGKWTDLTQIKIKPIIIKKCNTYLAIYGLSHVKDDRLCRLFHEKKVTFLEPEVEADKCFRILVLHQNRADRGPKRFISESFLPSFFDLVIWGHEHDCEIDPTWNMEKEFFVSQPGSTVATSLSEGESKPKHIALIRLWEDYSKFYPIKLNTVRPFVWRSISLQDAEMIIGDEKESKSVQMMEYCGKQVEEMIEEGKGLITGHPSQPKLPLIRLRCEYSDESQLFNIVKFGQQFLNRVATPNLEIIKLKKIVKFYGRKKESETAEVMKQLNELYGQQQVEENQNFTECVNRIVNDYFTEHPESKMKILTLSEMGNAVEKYIEKDEQDSIRVIVEKRLKKIMSDMMSHTFENEEEVEEELERMREAEENSKSKKEKNNDSEESSSGASKRKRPETFEISDSGTDEYEPEESVRPPVVTKKETPRSSARKNANASEEEVEIIPSDSDSEFEVEKVVTVKKRGGGRGTGRGRRGRGRSTAAAKESPSRASTLRSGERTKKPLKFALSNSVVYDSDDDDDSD